MSSCVQVISNARPSRAVHFVSPCKACLEQAYGDVWGRGTWADKDPLLIIRPGRQGSWASLAYRARGETAPTSDRHLVLEQLDRLAGAQECADEIDVDDLGEGFEREIFDRDLGRDCSCVLRAAKKWRYLGVMGIRRLLALNSISTRPACKQALSLEKRCPSGDGRTTDQSVLQLSQRYP